MTRDDIMSCAMSWLNTPYQHQVGLKGVGVDCAYFVGKVAEEVGAIEKFYVEPYSIEWHWHSKEEKMLDIVKGFGAIEVSTPQKGDILAFRYGRTCSHLGIYLYGDTFIHAHLKAGKVLVNSLRGEFKDRLEHVYQFPNLEE